MQIDAKLKKVNQSLKKYRHVNKKAFEQYNNFTTQQDQLMKRREELDASQGSIEELVEHLDRRKDEAIERTFKQVSREFSNIFEKLVPAGHGRLVIQRRTDRRQDPDESDEEARSSVENYIGVGISVSFNSKVLDEQQRIQQLSGGQKSELTLSLLPLPTNRNRSMCSVSHFCASADREQPHGYLRRGRRQPGRPVSYRRRVTTRVNIQHDRNAIHLYDFPTRDCPCCGQVLRRDVP